MENSQGKRLQVFMAACGAGSRRACEQLIAEGRVVVNGEVVTRQGLKVDPQTDVVLLDGRRLKEKQAHLYIALNKPPGFICTNQDPEGRPLALDLLGSIAKGNRLFSVGRLDLLSSGLIIYTNDGSFARAIAHPSSGVEKEYLVETRKPVDDAILDEFVRGISYGGIHYSIARYRRKTATRFLIVLHEGKNRELRNMFAARRVQIRRIHRVRIGSLNLGSLKPGEFRFLSRREIADLAESNSRQARDSGPAHRSIRRRSAKRGQ